MPDYKITETPVNRLAKTDIDHQTTPQSIVIPQSLEVVTVTPKPKHWYQSKTVWFNVFAVGASVATTAVPAVKQYMDDDTYGVLIAVVGVVNAILRFTTARPIATANNTPLSPIAPVADDDTEDEQDGDTSSE